MKVQDMPMKSALEVLQGNYIGVDVNIKRFGLCASLPKKYLSGGKNVLIEFFPEHTARMNLASYGLKNKISYLAIHMCGGDYIPVGMYKSVTAMATSHEEEVKGIAADIVAKEAELKKGYKARVKAAIEAEGITDAKAKEEILKTMMAKWPTKFNVEVGINAYAFPTPDDGPKSAAEEIQNAVAEGNNLRIIKAMTAVIGNIYNELFATASSVANSMEKSSYGAIAGRSRGRIPKAMAKAKEFKDTICKGGKISMGDTVKAIDTFEKVFVDNLDSITPTTARMYAAVLYNSAKKLGIESEIDLSSIGLDAETLEAVDWRFDDFD